MRSVSYSSDKFPPPSLNLARVSHQDQLPVTPSYLMTGVVPLPSDVDTSVPPPALPTPPPSLSSPLTFSMAKQNAWRSQRYSQFNFLCSSIIRSSLFRSPRISVSEIKDVSSPQPIKPDNNSNGAIK